MNLLTPGIILYSFYLSTCMDSSDSDEDGDGDAGGSMLPPHQRSSMFEGGLGSSFTGGYTQKDLEDKFPKMKIGKGPKDKGPGKPKPPPGPNKDPMMPTDQEARGASGGPGPYQPGQYPQGMYPPQGPYQPGPYPQQGIYPPQPVQGPTQAGGYGGGPYPQQGIYPPQGPYGQPQTGPYGQPGQGPIQTPGGYGQPGKGPAYPPDPYAQGPAYPPAGPSYPPAGPSYPPTGPSGAEGYGGGASGGAGSPGQPSGPPTEAPDGTKLGPVDAKNPNDPNVIVEEFREGPQNRLHRRFNPKPGNGFNLVKYDGDQIWIMTGHKYATSVLLYPIGFGEKYMQITFSDASVKKFKKKGNGKTWKEKD